MAKEIEVFQDLYIRGNIERRPDLREALTQADVSSWRFDSKLSAELARNGSSSQDVLLFRREAGETTPAAGLTLWGTDEGYHVGNIVPVESGSLSYSQYNAILTDFVERLAKPAAMSLGFEVVTTKTHKTLEDWLLPEAAQKLRSFSAAANKSTGASHPLDQRRWFDFIISVHRSGKKIDPSKLARWLHEAEGWDDDIAHELAGEFETAIGLLKHYDEN